MLEQGPDFWCWFDTTQFSYHCVHSIHAKMFSIQMSNSQIVQRVCTLVLFIVFVYLSVNILSIVKKIFYNNNKNKLKNRIFPHAFRTNERSNDAYAYIHV